MSKELEALEVIKEWSGVRDIDISDLEHYKYLEKVLTPPTADEVCEAIQKDLGETPILYNLIDREFYGYYSNEVDEIVGLRGNVIAHFRGKFSINTWVIIGKFYERLEKAGKEE